MSCGGKIKNREPPKNQTHSGWQVAKTSRIIGAAMRKRLPHVQKDLFRRRRAPLSLPESGNATHTESIANACMLCRSGKIMAESNVIIRVNVCHIQGLFCRQRQRFVCQD